jgi:hypothetical protein|tara:strand:+ start:52 stop:984 length:933 start_codon:yes stop_codon:yes gene_type:complete
MKKLSLYIFLGLLWCNNSQAKTINPENLIENFNVCEASSSLGQMCKVTDFDYFKYFQSGKKIISENTVHYEFDDWDYFFEIIESYRNKAVIKFEDNAKQTTYLTVSLITLKYDKKKLKWYVHSEKTIFPESEVKNILNIKCRLDTVREIGEREFKTKWFSGFKDKLGYKFDLKDMKLIESSFGKYSQKTSVSINIENDTEEKEYKRRTIKGTFSSIPKSNQNGAFMIFVYKITISSDNEIFDKHGQLNHILGLVHSTQYYRVTGAAINEWINFSPNQSYDDFQIWIGERLKDPLITDTSATAIGACDTIS